MMQHLHLTSTATQSGACSCVVLHKSEAIRCCREARRHADREEAARCDHQCGRKVKVFMFLASRILLSV